MKIRFLTQRDITKIKSITPEGWGEITPYFQYYLSNPNCLTFVAEENGVLLGSGNYFNLGKSGWLSHIIVIPEYRNQGIGKAMTELLISEHRKTNSLSLNLIATEMGEPVYKKLGFQTTSKYLFLKGKIKEPVINSGLRPLQKKDLPEILQMDEIASGEDRRILISPESQGWVLDSGAGLRGYFISNLWDGPIIANDQEAGFALLSKKMNEKEYVVLPEENKHAIHFLEKNGFNQFHAPGMRMVLGRPGLWNPGMIYGRIAGAFG